MHVSCQRSAATRHIYVAFDSGQPLMHANNLKRSLNSIDHVWHSFLYSGFSDVKPLPPLCCALDAMPNGSMDSTCERCKKYTECHPWGDPTEWYCGPCHRWLWVDYSVSGMQRRLFSSRTPASALLIRQILSDKVLAFTIIDFVETRSATT